MTCSTCPHQKKSYDVVRIIFTSYDFDDVSKRSPLYRDGNSKPWSRFSKGHGRSIILTTSKDFF